MISNEVIEVIGAFLGTGFVGTGTVAIKARKDTIKMHERVARLEEHRKNVNSALDRIEKKLDRLIEKDNI